MPTQKTHMAQIDAKTSVHATQQITRDCYGESQCILPHLDQIALSDQCANESCMFFLGQKLHQAELDYLKREWCVSLQYLDSFEDDTGCTKHVYYKTVTSQFETLIKKRKNQSEKISSNKIAKRNVVEAALDTTVLATGVLAATEVPALGVSATVTSADANMGTTATVSNMIIEDLTDDDGKEVTSADVASSLSLNQEQQVHQMHLIHKMQNVIHRMQKQEASLTCTDSETTPPVLTESADGKKEVAPKLLTGLLVQ